MKMTNLLLFDVCKILSVYNSIAGKGKPPHELKLQSGLSQDTAAKLPCVSAYEHIIVLLILNLLLEYNIF
jgi:hypothetical protein